MRLAGLLRGARLLQAAVCLSAAAAAAGALAQTEIRKTLPERPNGQSEVKKTLPGQALQSVEPPTKSTWSTEGAASQERGVSATDAQVTGDGRRTRFALHLSSAISYQI